MSVSETFIPFTTYNDLPHIGVAGHAPELYSTQLLALRDLLAFHKINKDVSIRLIHKHFDAKEGEILKFGSVDIANHGTARYMRPVKAAEAGLLRGLNFMVTEQGTLQAYEFSDHKMPDMAPLEPFFASSCELVVGLGVQHVFGLKIKTPDELDNKSWTEFEYHRSRSTIMLQEGMPMPKGDFDLSVPTEWGLRAPEDPRSNCVHRSWCDHGASKCTHCTHCGHNTPGDVDHHLELHLGGMKIQQQTPLYDFVQAIAVQVL